MAKQNFSGGTQYYRSGAYANPGSEVNLKNIARQGEVAMGIIQNNFLRTDALLKRESAKQIAAAQEAQNLLDWGINNEAEMMNDFQQESLKYGVNNESLNKLIEGKISTFSKATIGYKTATSPQEKAFYKKQMDASSKTLNSIVPMFEAMTSQAASLSNMEDQGNANQGGGLWFGNKTGNEILLGQTINAGRGGKDAYQRFTASEDGTLLMSAGANVPAQYKTTQDRKGAFGFYNKETGKFEKNPDQGQSTTTIDPNYKPQRITDVDAIQFFSRPIPTAPDYKKTITDRLDPILYDDKGNLKRQFYKTTGETDAGGNAILQEVPKTKYLPNGERVITYVNVPDMQKIGTLISNEVEQVGSGYFKNFEESQIIYNMLGKEGNIKAGANNSSLLYGNIEQKAADDILTGFAQFALNTGNFNDIKVREDRVKFDKPDKGGSGGKTKRDPKRYFESIRKNPLGQIKEAIGKGQTYANDEKPTVRNNIVKIPDKLLERFNFDLPPKEKGDLEYIEYDLNTQAGLVGFVNFIAKNSGYGFKGEFLQELGDIARQSAQEQDLYDSDNIEVINQDFSK